MEGFDGIDEAMRNSSKKRENQIRKELEAERKEKHGYKYSDQDPDRQLAHYPHANYKARDEATDNHEAAQKAKQDMFEAEVKRRLAEDRKTLEHAHFGKLGRDHALQQAMREEKLQAARRRFRKNNNLDIDPRQKFLDDRHEEKERTKHNIIHNVSKSLLNGAKSKSVTNQSSSMRGLINAQRHARVEEQDNSLDVDLKEQFTKQNDTQRQKLRADEIIDDFKTRRRLQETEAKEKAREAFLSQLRADREQKREERQQGDQDMGY